MTFNAGCWTLRLAALVIEASLLSGCARGGSEPRVVTVCPPVVEYSREFQARAADELDLLRHVSSRDVLLETSENLKIRIVAASSAPHRGRLMTGVRHRNIAERALRASWTVDALAMRTQTRFSHDRNDRYA